MVHWALQQGVPEDIVRWGGAISSILNYKSLWYGWVFWMSATMHQTQCTIKKNQVNILSLLCCIDQVISINNKVLDIVLFRVLKLWSGLKIIFDPTVEVAESTRIHTPLSVLSNIGGFLGLCLGYSLLDGGRALKILSGCIKNCQDRFFRRRQKAHV